MVDNVHSLCEQLEYAINNTHKMKTMAEEQYHFVYNNFPREVVWQALLEEYNQLSN